MRPLRLELFLTLDKILTDLRSLLPPDPPDAPDPPDPPDAREVDSFMSTQPVNFFPAQMDDGYGVQSSLIWTSSIPSTTYCSHYSHITVRQRPRILYPVT